MEFTQFIRYSRYSTSHAFHFLLVKIVECEPYAHTNSIKNGLCSYLAANFISILFSSVRLIRRLRYGSVLNWKPQKKRTTDWIRSSDGAATQHSTTHSIPNKICYQLEYQFSNLNVFFFKSLSRFNLVSAKNIASW